MKKNEKGLYVAERLDRYTGETVVATGKTKEKAKAALAKAWEARPALVVSGVFRSPGREIYQEKKGLFGHSAPEWRYNPNRVGHRYMRPSLLELVKEQEKARKDAGK